jgi:pyruvate/2-oxoglutarate dehydrogenase complex dihydrolipoamide acyltransferase (E2) component
MAYELKLPDLGEGLTEGEIARWLVSEGQEVAEDDPLVEVQTDKTTVEIPSPAAGKVARILVEEGQVVPVGTVLVVIGDGAAPARPAAAERVRATPLVRKVAQELGVDLAEVEATGPQGRITEDDVRRAAGPSEGRREPLRGVRRLIAEHMIRAHREVPPVTWVEECDFGNVDLKQLVPVTLKAAALALKEFHELNARLEGEEILYLDRYDLGFAVQTDQGLVVPVVRACDSRPLEDLDADVRRLAESAREGRLTPEELRGSTFTVSSAGKLAGLFQTPIVNHPEVAILSLGRIADRPVVRDGELAIRPLGYVALTFDHRVVDGARAAEFGLAVIARLEQGRGLGGPPAAGGPPTPTTTALGGVSRRAGRGRSADRESRLAGTWTSGRWRTSYPRESRRRAPRTRPVRFPAPPVRSPRAA